MAPLGVSNLESLWGTPLRLPSFQEAMVCPTVPANCPMAMGLEEQLVLPGARQGTQRAQGLAHRQHWQLRQQSMVLEELEPFLGLALSLALEGSQGPGHQRLQRRRQQKQPSMELPEAWCPVCQGLAKEWGFQALEALEVSQVFQELEESQELCHQPLLLKQPPRPPNMGPELEWVLEDCPMGESVLGVFLVSELELELALELQRRLRPPKQRSMVLGAQEPWEGWYLVCLGLEVCQEQEPRQQLQPKLPPKPPSMVQAWYLVWLLAWYLVWLLVWYLAWYLE